MIALMLLISLALTANVSVSAHAKPVNMSIELNSHLLFPNQTVVIKANFKPSQALIQDPVGNLINLSFEKNKSFYVAEFPLKKDVVLGNYTVVVDGLIRHFTVDYYTINASFNGTAVTGVVEYHFVKPEYICYISGDTKGKEEVNESGGFVVVPSGNFVKLMCGNAHLNLSINLTKNIKNLTTNINNNNNSTTENVSNNSVCLHINNTRKISDFKVIKVPVKGKVYPINVTLDRGKFEKLAFNDGNVTLKIVGLKIGGTANVTVTLPFRIPEGMHIYYWKEINNRILPVNYTIGKSRRSITFELRDGVVDEDGVANGVIVDPFKLYIPRFNVTSELNGREGILHVYDLNGSKLYDVRVEVSSGNLSYLAFVDSANLPSSPARFPYQLVKFKVKGLKRGEKVTVRITYPSLKELITDNGINYYKFNPRNLNWSNFCVKVVNNTLVFNVTDGGSKDDDKIANGVICDDGGVGWAGYSGQLSALIRYNKLHTYWIYVPRGDNFTVCLYDGDGFTVRVYYPNGNECLNSTANGNNEWNNFTIKTNGQFGWYKLNIIWRGNWTNYYGLTVKGADDINLRVNESYNVSCEKFYGTVDDIVVGSNEQVSQNQTYYVVGNHFKLAVYSPNSYCGCCGCYPATIYVYSPNGTLYKSWDIGNHNNQWWLTNISGQYGVWKVVITSIQDFYQCELAVNTTYGLWFKKPKLMKIRGRVLEDFGILGVKDSSDKGISNVTVALLKDTNGDGKPDKLVRTTKTNKTGYFNFTVVNDLTRKYYVAVNSRTVNTTGELNDNYTINDIWAEETYQTSDSNYSRIIPFFGGRDPNISDNWSAGIFEHYVTINCSKYRGEITFGFSFEVIVNTKDIDSDSCSNRYAQGTLRQFILNSNAIKGKQRSYFVMMVNPNSKDSYRWWTIRINSTLGNLPTLTDKVELIGTVLYPNLRIRDENPGYICYDYATHSLRTYSTQIEIPVGVGRDGIPFSGDEAKFKAIPKPEVEIYGTNSNPVLKITANNSLISNIAVFGSYQPCIESTGSNNVFENIFSGIRADGTDPLNSGFNRTGIANLCIEGNNTTVRNSVVAFAEHYGLLFNTSNVRSGKVENVLGFRNGLLFAGGYNFGVENHAGNVKLVRCISAESSGNGIESNLASEGIYVYNCTVEYNGLGIHGHVSKNAGVRIDANNSIVDGSLIRNNGVGVLVSNRLNDYSTKPVFNVTITENSIYNNTELGIDLADGGNYAIAFRGDNVTLNDGQLNPLQPNYGVDYPVISYAELNGSKLYVKGFINEEASGGGSPNFANAIVDIYLVKNTTGGDNLVGNNVSSSGFTNKYYGEGWIYLGSLTADSNGNFSGSIDVGRKVKIFESLITATATLKGKGTSEFGPDYQLVKFVNLQAGITTFWRGNYLNLIINVRAYRNMNNISVYWIKPENLAINNMTGNYNENRTFNNVYLWRFGNLRTGSAGYIRINASTTNASVLRIYNIGVDPR